MTATSIAKLVGQRGHLSAERGQLKFRVTIHDARSVYGRTEVLVVPVDGEGEAWVGADRVKLGGPFTSKPIGEHSRKLT